jgi:hypothetical protein
MGWFRCFLGSRAPRSCAVPDSTKQNKNKHQLRISENDEWWKIAHKQRVLNRPTGCYRQGHSSGSWWYWHEKTIKQEWWKWWKIAHTPRVLNRPRPTGCYRQGHSSGRWWYWHDEAFCQLALFVTAGRYTTLALRSNIEHQVKMGKSQKRFFRFAIYKNKKYSTFRAAHQKISKCFSKKSYCESTRGQAWIKITRATW